MNEGLFSAILVSACLGLGAGLILRLLRGLGGKASLRTWVVACVLVDAAYLLFISLFPSAAGTGVRIFLAAAVLLSANAVIQVMNVVLWDFLVRQRRNIPIPRLVTDILNFLLLAVVAIALLKSVFDVNLNALLVTSTVLSAVVGLSLQDVLGSVVAGLAIQMEKPFGVGDWIKVGEEEGVIVQMNWRTVAIRTRSHSEIIYPNSVITKESVTSFSAFSPFMVRLPVGLGYSHPPARVKGVLLSAVTQSGVALERPAPQVYLKSFDDFSISYEVRFWMDDYSRRQAAQDEVNTRIWYALKRAGMEIPFPIRDVNVRMVPEDIEQRRTASAREEVFEALRAVPLFEGLSDEQIRQVAAGSSMLGFCDGEYLVRQGEQGDSMFIVRRGDLRVEVGMPSGGVAQVAVLGPGDFFGEMSLLTGEPRSASIVARGEVDVVMLTKSEFASTVATDVKALERLSEALARRVAQIAERTAVSAPDSRQQASRTRSDLLGRIRGFFGI